MIPEKQRRTAKDLWRYWKITLAVEAAVIFLLPLDLYFCVWSCGTTFIPGFIFIFHLFLILVSTPLLGILVLPVLVSLILYLVAGIAANRDQNPKRWAWALRTLACGAAFVVSSALGYAFFYQFRIEVFQFVSPYVLVPLLAYHACLMACIQRAMKRATPGQFPRRSGSVTN